MSNKPDEEIREIIISKNQKELNEGCFFKYPNLKRVVCEGVIFSVARRTLSDSHINTVVFRADAMPLFAYPTDLIIPACKGFAEAYCEAAEVDPLVFKENVRFVRSHKKKLYDPSLYHIPLLQMLIREKLLTESEARKLLATASTLKIAEAAMCLLDYIHDNFGNLKESDEFEL